MFLQTGKSGIRSRAQAEAAGNTLTHAGAEQIRRSIKWKKAPPITPSSSAQSQRLISRTQAAKSKHSSHLQGGFAQLRFHTCTGRHLCVQKPTTIRFFGHPQGRALRKSQGKRDIMIRNSRAVINDLLALGVGLTRRRTVV